MKQVALILSLFIAAISFGQDEPISFPRKGAKIIFEEVIPVDSVKKEELYNRLKLWAISYFKTSEKELDTDDKSIGVIKGTGTLEGFTKGMQDYHLRFTFELSVKDNKYKYSFYDIICPYKSSFFSTEPLEYYFDYYLAGKKINRGVVSRFLLEAKEKITTMISSLNTAAKKSETDW